MRVGEWRPVALAMPLASVRLEVKVRRVGSSRTRSVYLLLLFLVKE